MAKRVGPAAAYMHRAVEKSVSRSNRIDASLKSLGIGVRMNTAGKKWELHVSGRTKPVEGLLKKQGFAKSGRGWAKVSGDSNESRRALATSVGGLKEALIKTARTGSDRPAMTGKRGGKYIVTKSGAKHYI